MILRRLLWRRPRALLPAFLVACSSSPVASAAGAALEGFAA
jgi:hypothetical protein